MGIIKRIITASLATVMLASVCLSAASCKIRSGTAKKVSGTDPWYTATRVELDPKFDPEVYTMVFPAGPFLCHDKYVMIYDAMIREYDKGD